MRKLAATGWEKCRSVVDEGNFLLTGVPAVTKVEMDRLIDGPLMSTGFLVVITNIEDWIFKSVLDRFVTKAVLDPSGQPSHGMIARVDKWVVTTFSLVV